ncbi:hypothetical protein M409DRAFT_64184 [Zasmidium cellare ATCC 36951]|uniref:Uncharacterized protein n=1 Tax=Zasmidium cellare ATCC 36951 TaxID=1080233 RepID=A0A6A6CXC5_ZASCE|nr:uncharacterized protein M409DRAFT_64184 [Zasmidium cellare ATCC 36951]KAF2170449.1 hypothetical protein M409DRAFT_64184 [Zasmidium cellare ATCC 36951]
MHIHSGVFARSLDEEPEWKRRYREEREKRLHARPEGSEQYRPIKGTISHYLDDPWKGIDEHVREPFHFDATVIIVGGGFAGQLMARNLLDQGIADFRIIEKGADFGGTWYYNRYPGAQCDTESYIYMPMLDLVEYIPTEKYAHGPELFQHARNIGEKLGLYEKTLFRTELKEIHWQQDSGLYTLKTDHGHRIRAQFVIGAAGSLHRPKLPDLPGLESFAGHSFHSSRWDYSYTGGDVSGNLARLQDKRVAIVGTGATAVQIVPHLADWAKKLYVVQRTPSSVGIRANRPTDQEWAKTLAGQWQKPRMVNFNTLLSGGRVSEDLVQDGWTRLRQALLPRKTADTTPEQLAEMRDAADLALMEGGRRRVDEVVKDKATAEALKPWYKTLCKRPCFHDEYLPAFNRPNVHLVDTQGLGVDHLTERGFVVKAKEYEVDCIVFATGFERATTWSHRAGVQVYGSNGKTFSEACKGGMETFQGWTSRGFPNFFIMSAQQSFFTPNNPHASTVQAEHLAYVIKECSKRGIRSVQPTAQAQQEWVDMIVQSSKLRMAFQAECTPGYYNNEGKVNDRIAKDSWYGGRSSDLIAQFEAWKEDGQLKGLELTPNRSSSKSRHDMSRI